jgi:ATP-dependent helicase HrpA
VSRPSVLPVIRFPDELPVSGKRTDIEQALREHQVIIVCGETGSGKTTQLPKIALAMGRGQSRCIGHTQPRRLAATSTAKRIAQELNTPLGEVVGFKIRFQDKSSRSTAIKLMTDGILLAETQGDPLLSAYDTLIIDEAHERSLNIDFLLGYLRQLLPRRPDLKLIITSATIDADRFARHFADAEGQAAPVIEVSGRLYPVDIRYRPIENKPGPDKLTVDNLDEADLNTGIVDAVDELCRLGPGDVLVFLPGEREIREAAQALRKHHPPATEILPLFARLSAAEQDRVFSPSDARRVVLATNVAETSLTVPGIRYVVDTGIARIKRYSYRNKVELLQVERIAQASANQRAGRCGRVAAGVCIRLYAEEDFNARPRFADPEILRSSLAGVILRMKGLGLGDVSAFPFVEAPSGRAIADGQQLLAELNAVDDNGALTEIGQQLSRLPLDPRVGRMILAARQHDCLTEMLLIASGLSVQDPRERPMAAQDAADNAHKKFADERSDFVAYLKMWAHHESHLAHKKSQRKLYDGLKAEFLSPLRLREWREVHSQLLSIVGEQGWRLNTSPASHEAIHVALLSGLLGNIGCKQDDENVYLGARGIKFYIHPGSHLLKKAGRWMMGAELMETSRLFARCVAKIEPDWLERVGAHLIKKSWHDPHWEKKQAQVVAHERGTLYGLVVYNHRRINYATMDRMHAREVFIREALVAGQWETRLPFFVHNQRMVREIEQMEHKVRRQDMLVDDELIFSFYDQQLSEDVFDGKSMERWWSHASKDNTKLLFLSRQDLMRKQAGGITTEQYPKQIQQHGASFALTYHFEPGSPRDGVTLVVPLVALNQVDVDRCDWLVPGMLKEKVQLLVKSLPQRLRRHCVPLPEYTAAFCDRYADPQAQQKPLIDALIEDISLNTPARPIVSDFRVETLPSHLLMNFKLIDEHGRQLDMQRSLGLLKGAWQKQAQAQFQSAAATAAQEQLWSTGDFANTPSKSASRTAHTPSKAAADSRQTGAGQVGAALQTAPVASATPGGQETAPTRFTTWAVGPLPELLEIRRGAHTLIGYPALVDEGDACRLDVFDDPEQARATHHQGLRRLFAIALKDPLKYLDKNLPDLQRCAMLYMPMGSADDLKQQWIALAIDRACLSGEWPNDEASFEHAVKEGRTRLNLIAQEIGRILVQVLTEWQQVSKKLTAINKAFPLVVQDIELQVQYLLPKRFLLDRPWHQLAHYPRYFKAMLVRMDRLRNDAARDTQLMREMQILQSGWQKAVASLKGRTEAGLEEFGWQLQELRVSLFAQELRTPMPVSVKRLQKAWEMLSQRHQVSTKR